MSNRAVALRGVLRLPIVLRSLAIALAVGTVLNLINQGDRLAAGTALEWGKLALNYLVPFVVASFGAWSALATRGCG